MTFKALTQDTRFIKLSEGNNKLVPNKDTKFLVWNLPSITTCPYATEHCKSFCYARKAEKAYPSVMPSRLAHLEASRKPDFVERMIFTIEAYLSKPSYKTAKKVVVRVHESGDFYSAEYMAKWFEIAEHFKGDHRIVFMAYTKSLVYINYNVPKNVVVRFSVWDDTEASQIELADKWGLPTYSAVDRFTNEPSQSRCLCRDCARCGKCWSRTKSVVCEIH